MRRDAGTGDALGDSFVLWIDRHAPTDVLRGTIEHVATSRRDRFEGVDQLLALLRRGTPASQSGGSRGWKGIP